MTHKPYAALVRVAEAARGITGMTWPREQFDAMSYGFTPKTIALRDMLDALDAAPGWDVEDVAKAVCERGVLQKPAPAFDDPGTRAVFMAEARCAMRAIGVDDEEGN